jgi:hypothetical protein
MGSLLLDCAGGIVILITDVSRRRFHYSLRVSEESLKGKRILNGDKGKLLTGDLILTII